MNQQLVVCFSLFALLAGCRQKASVGSSPDSLNSTNPKGQLPLSPQPAPETQPIYKNPAPQPTVAPAPQPTVVPAPQPTVNPEPLPPGPLPPGPLPSPDPSSSPPVVFLIDPPTVTNPASLAVTNGAPSLTIAGTCAAGNTVKLAEDSQLTTPCSAAGTYSFVVSQDLYRTFQFYVSQQHPTGALSSSIKVEWQRVAPPPVSNACDTPSGQITARPKQTLQYKTADANTAAAKKLVSLDVYGLQAGTWRPGEKCLGYPVVVYVHSGLWKSGDMATGVAPKVKLFNKNGFVFVSVNHRLSKTGVAHPAHMQDLRDAVLWIQQKIQDHGGDPHRISLMGHESGGHMASLISLSRHADPKATANFSLSNDAREGIQCTVSVDSDDYDLVARARGGSTAQKSAIRGAFGTIDGQVWTDASPLFQILGKQNLEIPRFLVITQSHGGNTERVAGAQEFVTALRAAAGDEPHELFNAGNLSWSAVDDAITDTPTAAQRGVSEKVLGFLKGCYGIR